MAGSKRIVAGNPTSADSMLSIEKVADTLKAMAYLQRLRILQALSVKGMYFSELMELTGLKKTALNKNLQILTEAKLITQEHRKGRYLARETSKKLLQILSQFTSDMPPATSSYMKEYCSIYDSTRKRRQILEGVPSLGWGRDMECTFFGALDATLRFLGEPVDYTYLMGTSAAAFRFRFFQPWCPSSADAAFNVTYAWQALKATGCRGEFLTAPKVSQESINQVTREELEKEKPVVAFNLMECQDWGVVAGYQNNRLLCRSYHSQGDEYSLAEMDPRIILKIEKTELKPNRDDSLRDSLLLAVDLANKDKVGPYANGFAAFDVWIENLENEKFFKETDESTSKYLWHTNAWIYASLYDARLTAAKYLRRIEEDFQGAEKDIIPEAAEKFENVKDTIFDNWVHFPYSHEVRKARGTTWTPRRNVYAETWTEKMRKKGADVLKTIKQKENEAFEVLSRL